jgi:hypothetical protein
VKICFVFAIVDHLADAPEVHRLVDRWNWWMGSLDISKSSYQRFQIHPDIV